MGGEEKSMVNHLVVKVEVWRQMGGDGRVGGHTIPRLTVSFTRPPSNSSLSVSAESREVVAMRRP